MINNGWEEKVLHRAWNNFWSVLKSNATYLTHSCFKILPIVGLELGKAANRWEGSKQDVIRQVVAFCALHCLSPICKISAHFNTWLLRWTVRELAGCHAVSEFAIIMRACILLGMALKVSGGGMNVWSDDEKGTGHTFYPLIKNQKKNSYLKVPVFCK